MDFINVRKIEASQGVATASTTNGVKLGVKMNFDAGAKIVDRGIDKVLGICYTEDILLDCDIELEVATSESAVLDLLGRSSTVDGVIAFKTGSTAFVLDTLNVTIDDASVSPSGQSVVKFTDINVLFTEDFEVSNGNFTGHTFKFQKRFPGDNTALFTIEPVVAP